MKNVSFYPTEQSHIYNTYNSYTLGYNSHRWCEHFTQTQEWCSILKYILFFLNMLNILTNPIWCEVQTHVTQGSFLPCAVRWFPMRCKDPRGQWDVNPHFVVSELWNYSDLLHRVQIHEKEDAKVKPVLGLLSALTFVRSTDCVLVRLVFVLFTRSVSPLQKCGDSVFTPSTPSGSGSSCGGQEPERQQQAATLPCPPPRGPPSPHSCFLGHLWEGVWDPLPSSPGSPCCGCGGRDVTHFLLCLERLSGRQSC